MTYVNGEFPPLDTTIKDVSTPSLSSSSSILSPCESSATLDMILGLRPRRILSSGFYQSIASVTTSLNLKAGAPNFIIRVGE
jgi:hypothetical protein